MFVSPSGPFDPFSSVVSGDVALFSSSLLIFAITCCLSEITDHVLARRTGSPTSGYGLLAATLRKKVIRLVEACFYRIMSAAGRIDPAAAWEAMPKYDKGGLEVHRLKMQVPLVYKDIEHPKIVKDKMDKLKRRQLTLATFRIRLKGRESVAGKSQTIIYLQGGPGFQSFFPKQTGTWREYAVKFGFDVYLMD